MHDLLRKYPLKFGNRKPIEVIESLRNSHIREDYMELVILNIFLKTESNLDCIKISILVMKQVVN